MSSAVNRIHQILSSSLSSDLSSSVHLDDPSPQSPANWPSDVMLELSNPQQNAQRQPKAARTSGTSFGSGASMTSGISSTCSASSSTSGSDTWPVPAARMTAGGVNSSYSLSSSTITTTAGTTTSTTSTSNNNNNNNNNNSCSSSSQYRQRWAQCSQEASCDDKHHPSDVIRGQRHSTDINSGQRHSTDVIRGQCHTTNVIRGQCHTTDVIRGQRHSTDNIRKQSHTIDAITGLRHVTDAMKGVTPERGLVRDLDKFHIRPSSIDTSTFTTTTTTTRAAGLAFPNRASSFSSALLSSSSFSTSSCPPPSSFSSPPASSKPSLMAERTSQQRRAWWESTRLYRQRPLLCSQRTVDFDDLSSSSTNSSSVFSSNDHAAAPVTQSGGALFNSSTQSSLNSRADGAGGRDPQAPEAADRSSRQETANEDKRTEACRGNTHAGPSKLTGKVAFAEDAEVKEGDAGATLPEMASHDPPAETKKESARDIRRRCVHKSATTTVLNCQHVSFDLGDTGPEMSDAEQEKRKEKEAMGKKRRFGKRMLPNPLRRSQSAGCAKDVPAHALFLQHRLGDRGIDTLEERLARPLQCSSSSSISTTYGRRGSGPGREGDSPTRKPPPPHARPIHKTASADAAMMARDEYGNITCQSKGKKSLAKAMKRKLLFLRRRHTDTTLGTVMKGDGKQVNKIHPDDALQWSRSFESLLLDKTGLELFRGFLRSEFSDENLEFWIVVEEFKQVKDSKVPAMAQKIYTDFVAAQAPREINLDSKTRVRTLANLNTPSKEVFEEAQRKVQALMEKDSYPRFLESDVYQRIIRGQKS